MATVSPAAFGGFLGARASWAERLAAAGLPAGTSHPKLRATTHLGSRVAQHKLDEQMIAALVELDPVMLADPARADFVLQHVRARLARTAGWKVK